MEKSILVIKSTGGAGLGDLLRTVLSGVHYAKMSNRSIYVCWDDGLYGPAEVNIFSKLFRLKNIEQIDSLTTVSHEESVYPEAWRGKLDKSLNTLYAELREDDWNRSWALQTLSFNQTRFDFQEEILVMWDFDGFAASWNAAIPGYRYGSSSEEGLCLLAHKHLRAAKELEQEAAKFRDSSFTSPMIGVHIRKTHEKGSLMKQANEHAYVKSITAIRSKHPEAGIFLATDNVDVEASLRRYFPDMVTWAKWFPNAGEAIHHNEKGPDKFSRAKDAVVEMLLLASCDYLIYPALSSFSQSARYLSGLPDDRVIPLRKVTGIRHFWEHFKHFLTIYRGSRA